MLIDVNSKNGWMVLIVVRRCTFLCGNEIGLDRHREDEKIDTRNPNLAGAHDTTPTFMRRSDWRKLSFPSVGIDRINRRDFRSQSVHSITMAEKGFVFECQDGEKLEVTSSQASELKEKCDYFENIFAHGTIEAQDLVVRKPDWTLATATNLVNLITTGSVLIQKSVEYTNLAKAADQILLPGQILLLPPSCIQKQSISSVKELEATMLYCMNRSQLADKENRLTLVTPKKITSLSWQNLLGQSVIVISTDEEFRVGWHRPPRHSNTSSDSKTTIVFPNLFVKMCGGDAQGPTARFPVDEYAIKSVKKSIAVGLDHFCSILRGAKGDRDNKKVFHSEEFSIRVPCDIIIADMQLLQTITKETQASGYIHGKSSLGYYLDGGNDIPCPTFFGTFEQLRHALSLIPIQAVHEDRQGRKRCSLRVCAPNHNTLQHLIASTHHCQDNPGTFGVDIATNAYFAVKSVSDMKLMLSYLAGNACPEPPKHPTKVTDLTYPKGVF